MYTLTSKPLVKNTGRFFSRPRQHWHFQSLNSFSLCKTLVNVLTETDAKKQIQELPNKKEQCGDHTPLSRTHSWSGSYSSISYTSIFYKNAAQNNVSLWRLASQKSSTMRAHSTISESIGDGRRARGEDIFSKLRFCRRKG